MTTAHVFIAASIDGFIARPDDDIAWLTLDGAAGEDHGFEEFYGTMDGIIMGRRTWEKVCTFGDWPFAKPVIVLSRERNDRELPPDQEGRVRFLDSSPSEALAQAESEGWKRAYVDGGLLIQAFLAEGLIEDLILTRIPILIGQGRPLFGDLAQDIRLKHIMTRAYPSGLVQSKYAVLKCQ